MKPIRSRGGGWVVAQFILMAAQALSVARKRSQWPAPASCALGGALFAIAAFVGVAGTRALGRNLTPLPEPKAEGNLVTTGIYAHVRHPLYTSVLAGAFGWSFLWRSWPALFLAVIEVLFFREKAKHEEARLRARFPEYTSYQKRVPRFLPKITPGSPRLP